VTDSIGGPSIPSARADVMAALRSASSATGVDFGFLVKTAQRESNFDPAAKASTSSAAGLFQFTNATWLDTVERYGARHGIDTHGLNREQVLALRDNPEISARMGAELAAENARILEQKIGRPVTPGELYLAHFLGPSDAAKLIDAARTNGGASATDLLPRAAAANVNVFNDRGGDELTAAGLYQKLTGFGIAAADAGQAGTFDASGGSNANALLQARLGTAALTSSLMAALFGLQEDNGPGWGR
jgi:hypothetical protein